MTRIFISHASDDDAAVTEVAAWLSSQGFNDHFVDHIDIPAGVSWDRELPREVNKAEIVLVYLTQSWLDSSECLAEYRASYYSGKVVVPLLISDRLVDLSPQASEDLQRICSSVQGVSITTFPPDDVVARLLRGSLVLASDTIKWTKRKQLIRRISVAFAAFAVVLGVLSFFFRDYIGAYYEKLLISSAFSEIPAAEFSARFADAAQRQVSERTFRECSDSAICPEMIVLPAGRFRLGASAEAFADPSELPHHLIDVPQFAVASTEISQGQWRACFISTQLDDAPKCKQAPALQSGDKFPVDSVSWLDAQNYVKWLNLQIVGTSDGPYRLLSEAEWEYAARGLTSVPAQPTIYYWGDTLEDACKHANALNASMPTLGVERRGIDCGKAGRDQFELASAIAEFPANRFGLFDMAGNLAEWVEDCWHDSYQGRPDGPGAWTESAERRCHRVVRGGSWIGKTDNLRVAARSKLQDDRFGFNIGFRVARDLDWAQPE